MRNYSKKGQAAMEFLMTYGWAILVVLAAISALAYFGVLSPDRFLPEKCTMPSGIACTDFSYDTTNGIILQIQNGGGIDMINAQVVIAGCGPSEFYNLSNGNAASFTVACTNLASGKFKADVNFTYMNKASGLSHNKVGEIILKIA